MLFKYSQQRGRGSVFQMQAPASGKAREPMEVSRTAGTISWCWFVGGDELTAALHITALVITTSITLGSNNPEWRHASLPIPVSEMTYTVSSRTLNPSMPYHTYSCPGK